MDERTAKSKWCPMVRHEGEDHGSYNRGGVTDPINAYGIGQGFGCNCIASACMMWRREKDTYGDDYGKDIPEDRGFCGIGGWR